MVLSRRHEPVFVMGKERKKYRKTNLPIVLGRFPEFERIGKLDWLAAITGAP